MRFAAFLRGVNVGGHRPLKMADLRAAFEGMGFENVQTILASGNVVFDSDVGDERALSERIEAELDRLFGYPITVIVRRLDDLVRLVESDPFKGVAVTPDTRFYVTFVSLPVKSETGASPAHDSEGGPTNPATGLVVVRVSSRDVLSAVTISPGFGTPELMTFLEKEFGPSVTTRGWNTIRKIVDR
jgi:uncharacterized protein (DUF1697 family)